MRLTQAAYEQQQQQHAYEQELHEEEQRQAHAARQVLACAHARSAHPRMHAARIRAHTRPPAVIRRAPLRREAATPI
jgi:hypothetical protein